MDSITLNAPAKINLYLDVLSKRKDNYHNIATIFQKIKLSDTVKVSHAPKGISLDCKYPNIPTQRANIAYKTAKVIINQFNIKSGVKISIKKKIPSAAGLGGGSSDAAAVILAMNKLFNLNIPLKELSTLGKNIGADVPFFLAGCRCAIGRGIGDSLKELIHRKNFHILLIVPKIKVYTKTIYSELKLPLTKNHSNVTMLARILADAKCKDLVADSLYNRLEEIVLPRYSLVRCGKEMLAKFTDMVLVSGSGPTIFGLFSTRKEAARVKTHIKRDRKWQLFLTETL